MSLSSGPVPPVPDETARVACAAFPGGNPYVRMRDELDSVFEDAQFAEGLSDRQAADAVRGRIDWTYALSLELSNPRFEHTVLSEFRGRLLEGGVETLLLGGILARCRERGLRKTRGRQRTDSTHVLAAVRALNRLELVR